MPITGTAESVTRLMLAVRAGQSTAMGNLFESYFERLVQLARKRLANVPGMSNYEEDVALQSFHSVCRRMRDPDRPLQLEGRDDLWRILATRTISRAIDLIRRHKPGEVPGDADVVQLLNRDPTPEAAAEMADECRRLLDMLGDQDLRRIALWKVEGHTNEEIATRLDCVPRTVERKVSRIRQLWRQEVKESEV